MPLATTLEMLLVAACVLAFGVAALVVGYLLVFALASRRRLAMPPETPPELRFAVFIPAYQEDAVIVDTARRALDQSYPRALYEVVVIADTLQPATLAALGRLPVTIAEVAFEQSTKAKALNAALSLLAAHKEAFDGAVVLDADNVMDRDALARLAAHLQAGALVVQGRRIAKNLDTPMARLDALSEGINSQIFRAGHAALGLSAALIGSGMAFDYALFDRFMQRAKAVGGFDKELELMLLREGVCIAWAPEVVIYDEKVRDGATFENQRTRRLAAQGHYLRRYAASGLRALLRGHIDYANKVLQMALPPRALLVVGLPLVTAGVYVAAGIGAALPWLALTGALALALGLAIPDALRRADVLAAFAYLPVGVWRMVRALARSPGGNRSFIHTPHGRPPHGAPVGEGRGASVSKNDTLEPAS